ncbi:MAG: YdcF family protein [Candidatus Doudnabacteria bacterium]|nr:YdcF family protein [Candidatus Doudnabacteria bacterium]
MRPIIKVLKWLFGIFIVLLLLDIFLVVSFAVFSSQYQKADAIIVLGAAINSPALYNRSIEALRLYQEGQAPVIVLSGGRISDKDLSEAAYMQRAIQNKSTKPLNLILDEQSGNTFENIKNSKARLGSAKSAIIVTDKFHLARSVITAKALGFKDVYWSAPDTKYPSRELYYHYLREVAAIMAYIPKFIIQRR